MNNLTRIALLLLAADIAPFGTAQRSDDIYGDPATEFGTNVLAIERAPRRVAIGMTPDDVMDGMQARPDYKLSDEVWVYWDCSRLAPVEGKYDTMVVTFSAGRVHRCRFVEAGAMRGLIADLRKVPSQIVSEFAVGLAADGHMPPAPRRIAVGMTAKEVFRAMHGAPDQQLASDLWVYRNFRVAADEQLGAGQTLVVRFSRDRVTRCWLVRDPIARAVLDDSPSPLATASLSPSAQGSPE